MVRSSNRKARFWYGYLKAGTRSSPVLRDPRLDTGNSRTLYMFNLVRGEILEYAREIVEKKMRELKPSESEFVAELDIGYKKARRNFKGRGTAIHRIRGSSTRPSHEKEEWVDVSAFSDNITDDIGMLVDADEL
jgi:hypothetical protein